MEDCTVQVNKSKRAFICIASRELTMVLKYLQRLGKSLILPVSCLPVAGILMGLGYLMAPSAVQGGETEQSLLVLIGTLCVQAGGAIIKNMSVLFAIGIAFGMAKERDGTAALAGLVAWIIIQQLLGPSFVTKLTDAQDAIAFTKINNQFIGILCGIIGATCYNKFRSIVLPDFLAFFSGKRAVAIVTTFVAMLISALLYVIWPILYNFLIFIGEAIVSLGAVGAGVYAFLNRLLVPIGLHHALNAVFWFDIAGISDLTNFWDSTGTYGVTGMYMTGFFPVMMFGLPAAALAMYHTARPGRKKVAFGLLASAALCSFFTGITEPLEFAFMFLAPGLYFLYAVLTGVVAAITVLLPIRAGFSFSAGFLDLFFSSQMPLAQNPWFVCAVGLVTAVLYYSVFRFVIIKWNLPTPGRIFKEDEDPAFSPAKLKNNSEPSAIFKTIASQILEGLGGRDNIVDCDNCVTRIRLEIKDRNRVDDKKLIEAGAKGVLHPSDTNVQVIIGTQVQFVVDQLKTML